MTGPAAPYINWEALSPLLALLGGAVVVLLAGLLRSRFVRESAVPFLAIAAFGAALGLGIWQWDVDEPIIAGALRIDHLTLAMTWIFAATGIATVLLSWRAVAPREAAHGEYYALLLTAAAGMVTLAGAENLVTVFVGYELLSIPLYVLCATELRRTGSLESGLKYLIVGSVGSATLLYGLAMLYGATGETSFGGVAEQIGAQDLGGDPLLLTGIALVLVGIAFKASIAPFHQWTPDVYEGAPTPVTAFMAVATKAAAVAVALRFFNSAVIEVQPDWAPVLAVLATVTIVVGNVGALGQTSVKRLLAWSSVAQAGYMLGGVVVATRLGLQATVFYLFAYLALNVAAFAVVVARERESGLGDDIRALDGIGAARPLLAWPMTLAMLGLAGIPATAGFVGKVYLIQALADGGYTWLGVVIVVGSMISLAYYLRVIAAMWMRPARAPQPALAGGSSDVLPAEEAPRAGPQKAGWEVGAVAVVSAAAILALGVFPQPLFDLAEDVGRALGLL